MVVKNEDVHYKKINSNKKLLHVTISLSVAAANENV